MQDASPPRSPIPPCPRCGATHVVRNGLTHTGTTDLEGRNFQLTALRDAFTQNPSVPAITGNADFVAKATGRSDVPSSYSINFSGTARDVVINENTFGQVTFQGNTANQILNADLTATLEGRPQICELAARHLDEPRYAQACLRAEQQCKAASEACQRCED